MRPRLILGLLALLAAIGIACTQSNATPTLTSSAASTQEVEENTLANFEDILVRAWTGTSKSHSASLVVETKTSVVCTWAYEPTMDYGHVTTHTDATMSMPHMIHSVELTGLKPDTLYHYRFFAVGENGSLFRSGDFTFRTLLE